MRLLERYFTDLVRTCGEVSDRLAKPLRPSEPLFSILRMHLVPPYVLSPHESLRWQLAVLHDMLVI